MRWVDRAVVPIVVLLTATTVGVPSSAAADAPPGGSAHQRSATLITGDRVRVAGLPGGKRSVTVLPGPGRDQIGFVRHVGKDRSGREKLVVIPTDALALLEAGTLDRRLFDVAELVRHQRDDQSTATLPLIVTYHGQHRPALAGLTAELSSVNGSAIAVDKNQLGQLWTSLTAQSASASGIAKVWLDGKASFTDEESNTQIGAPQAWNAGYTGKGVTVAVLDGGYDATHPDLAGVVAEAKDFTASPDGVKDTYGHGTHVASTIAGSGAASGGRHRGVAPDARLLVGKVCVNRSCDESAIMAGMEWAASRARIVSMSLGGPATDGRDPLSMAVNQLSAQYGALFVISAGNDGSGSSTVGTPAVADAALAVGSVNKADRLSWFSSRGPRIGDYAVKPDLTAPGESIIAARAAGTSMGNPVDERYTRADGTSMAAPHVSGSAAILAQRHPDFTAAQLKAALASAATPVAGQDVYQQGSGRLDIAMAVKQSVQASPTSLSFGLLTFPQTALPPITRSVTYSNPGDTPVTLELAVTGSIPAGALTPLSDRVTVPARGQSTVDFTLTPGALHRDQYGTFSAQISATGPAGIAVGTAIGVSTEPESYDLTINLIDRAGQPVASSPYLQLVGLTTIAEPELPPLVNGSLTVRVPKASYGLHALIATGTTSQTWASQPRIQVDGPTTITVDARKGQRVSAEVDRRDAVPALVDLNAIYIVSPPGGDNFPWQDGFRTKGTQEVYAVPVQADPSYFEFGVHQTLVAPPERGGYAYYLAFPEPGRIPGRLAYRVRDRQLAVEQTRYRAQGQAATGARSSVPDFLPHQVAIFAAMTDVPLPSRRTEFYTPGQDIRWSHYLWQRPQGQPNLTDFDGEIDAGTYAYQPGERRTQTWNSAVLGTDISAHPWNQVTRYGATIGVLAWPYAPAEASHAGSAVFGSSYVTAAVTLSKPDGTVLGTSPRTWGYFSVEPGSARYQLEVKSDRAPKWSALATRVSTRWSFTSAATAELSYPPLLTLRTSGPFDDYNSVSARAWVPLDIAVRPQAQSTGGAAVKRVSVELSLDEGKSWRALLTWGKGPAWHALAPPAGRAGFAALRIRAEAADGNSVEQTTIRAFGITP